ncbi:transposase [Kocuria himachalensis]
MEARRDPATKAGALARIGQQLGIDPETLRNWVRQAEVDGGYRPGTTTNDAQRLAELEKEVRELRGANAILRSASAFFVAEPVLPTPQVVACIDAHQGEFGVELICKVLPVAPSTYYAAKTRPPSARSISDAATTAVIATVHADNYGVYGVSKVHAELPPKGHRVAHGAPRWKASGVRGLGVLFGDEPPPGICVRLNP